MKLKNITKHLARRHRHNVATFRKSPMAEISGAVGDLGTFLPLTIALAKANCISLSSTLVWTGIFNIITGAVFGIPLPVQPMKAIAAAGTRHRMTYGVVQAAGAYVSAAVLLLSATGLLRWATRRVVPAPVVKGIQFGAGLNLVLSMLVTLEGRPVSATYVPLLALLAVLVLATSPAGRRWRRPVPFALVVFVFGVAVALWSAVRASDRLPHFAPWVPRLANPKWWDWRDAPGLAVGQLPLTTLNSVIAVTALSADLLPEVPAPGVTAVGFSVAAMNLVGCWFGAMPVCHGSGGLAAQWRFGARSGASVMLLGMAKLLLGLVFGDSLMGIIDRFPRVLLGVMVFGAGIELCRVGVEVNEDAVDLWLEEEPECGFEDDGAVGVSRKRKMRELDGDERKERWMVMLVTMAAITGFSDYGFGFLVGMLCHWFYRLADRWERRRAHGEMHI